MTTVYVLETFDNNETQGVCGVFSSREKAIEGAIAMVKRSWLDYRDVFFLVAAMGLDNDNHTFDTANVFRFDVIDGTAHEVEYCSWNGWVRKNG